MKIERTASAAFLVQFESEREVQDGHRALSSGTFRLPKAEAVPVNATLLVTLLGPWGGEAFARATVVERLPEGIAIKIGGDTDTLLDRLLVKPTESPAGEAADEPGKQQNAWDRVRGLSQMEKLLLAVKAEKSERALLVQDNDPRVLLSILRNPRLTVDEVVRVAKSSFLTYQIVDVIIKTGHWMGNLDVRLALIHNPKTPPAFALRILTTLPESEVRVIARTGTNMTLKQAALRRLHRKN